MNEPHFPENKTTQAREPLVEGVSFTVADMTCSHCESTVRAALDRALPGARVEVDLDAHRVTVAGDAAVAAAAIRAAGYTPQATRG